MSYLEQWAALSARIRGLMHAGQLHANRLAVKSEDSFGRGEAIRKQCLSIFCTVKDFKDRFETSMPIQAKTAIDNFIDTHGKLLSGGIPGSDVGTEQAISGVVLLATLETELAFLFSDAELRIRAISERALAHLQRTIVVDADVRSKWKEALKTGEVECEKLGAIHLLLHGIWAFKVNAAGGRTDLVFQEPRQLGLEQDFADGLVLTEWKTLTSSQGAKTRFEDARKQAQRYSVGVLAGNELTTYRYAVLVSAQQIQPPLDLREGGCVYRHINIAVDPLPPSKSRPKGA